jgi:hypothetical protein
LTKDGTHKIVLQCAAGKRKSKSNDAAALLWLVGIDVHGRIGVIGVIGTAASLHDLVVDP